MLNNLINNLKSYQTAWAVVEEGPVPAELASQVTKTEVVLSTYGTSLKMWLKDGTTKYIPMSEQSKLMVGSTPNINEVSLIVLAREGDEPILRVK